MLKQITSAGLILGLSFGAGGAAFASDEKEAETSIDLSKQLNAELADGDLMSNEKLKGMAENNDWSSEDFRVWAKSKGMTEIELREWAEDSGWSEDEIAELNLSTGADAQLDSLLDSSNKEHEGDGLLNDLFNNLF